MDLVFSTQSAPTSKYCNTQLVVWNSLRKVSRTNMSCMSMISVKVGGSGGTLEGTFPLLPENKMFNVILGNVSRS